MAYQVLLKICCVPSPSEPGKKQFQEFRKPLHSNMFNSGKYIASDRDCEK